MSADLERENAELKATLAAVFDANERGRKAWQEAHPEKEMVWPDQAKLVEWLLRENAALQAHAERLGDANDQMVVENAAIQKDSERLDWIIGKAHYLFFKELASDLAKGREQIDSARTEAQL
jgi:hypothetical protein